MLKNLTKFTFAMCHLPEATAHDEISLPRISNDRCVRKFFRTIDPIVVINSIVHPIRMVIVNLLNGTNYSCCCSIKALITWAPLPWIMLHYFTVVSFRLLIKDVWLRLIFWNSQNTWAQQLIVNDSSNAETVRFRFHRKMIKILE